MGRMEVRCCCDANIVYGTVPVDRFSRPGQRIRFALLPDRRESVELEVGELWADHDYSFALKSMHVPGDVIRRIDGFQPTTF